MNCDEHGMDIILTNPWDFCAQRFGISALLPAVPHDAKPASASRVTKFGKIPSVFSDSGAVGFVSWVSHATTTDDVATWRADTRLNVCVRGEYVPAIDVDIEDAEEVSRVLAAFSLGDVLTRTRDNSPRVLIPVKTDIRRKMVFGNGTNRIELLANGQHWIASGVHASGSVHIWRNPHAPIAKISRSELVSRLASIGYAVLSAAGDTPAKVERDRVLTELRKRGLVRSETNEKAFLVCPWEAEHSTPSTGTDTVYFKAHTGGRSEPAFKCLHSHCAGKHAAQLAQWLGLAAIDLAAQLELPLPHTGKIKTLDAARELVAPYAPQYDKFTDKISYARGVLDDGAMLSIRSELSKRGAELSKEFCSDAIAAIARDNEIDSLHDWCNALVWDGVPRVDGALTTYFKLADSNYHTAVSRYMFSALACRAMRAGTDAAKADMIVVLSGPEGIGKSTAIAALAPFSSAAAEVDLSTKDADIARALRGVCVVELSELRGYTKRGEAEFKAWVTRSHDAWVPKFREYETRMPRRCVFFGSTNDETWLASAGRNRRYLPIYVTEHVDLPALRRDTPQLWAEALATFNCVEWYEADSYAKESRARAVTFDAWEAVECPASLTAAEFLSLIGVQIQHQTPRDLARAADVLRKKGYTQARKNGTRVWAVS